MGMDRSGDSSDFKLVIVGDAGVGKSQLINRIRNDSFSKEYYPTIGGAFTSKPLGKDRVNFDIWDIGGQEQYQSLAPMYFNRSSAVILAFDLSNHSSFDNLAGHLKRVQELNVDIPIFLVGTKSDKAQAVAQSEIDAFRDANDLQEYFVTSAKEDNVGVKELFEAVADTIVAAASVRKVPLIVESEQNPSSLGFLRRHIGKILAGAVMLGGIAALAVFTGGLALTLLPLAKGLIVAGTALLGVVVGVIAGRCKDKENAILRDVCRRYPEPESSGVDNSYIQMARSNIPPGSYHDLSGDSLSRGASLPSNESVPKASVPASTVSQAPSLSRSDSEEKS